MSNERMDLDYIGHHHIIIPEKAYYYNHEILSMFPYQIFKLLKS